jgi:hypothetical protein
MLPSSAHRTEPIRCSPSSRGRPRRHVRGRRRARGEVLLGQAGVRTTHDRDGTCGSGRPVLRRVRWRGWETKHSGVGGRDCSVGSARRCDHVSRSAGGTTGRSAPRGRVITVTTSAGGDDCSVGSARWCDHVSTSAGWGDCLVGSARSCDHGSEVHHARASDPGGRRPLPPGGVGGGSCRGGGAPPGQGGALSGARRAAPPPPRGRRGCRVGQSLTAAAVRGDRSDLVADRDPSLLLERHRRSGRLLDEVG